MLFPGSHDEGPGGRGGMHALYSQRKAAQSTSVAVAPLSTGPATTGVASLCDARRDLAHPGGTTT